MKKFWLVSLVLSFIFLGAALTQLLAFSISVDPGRITLEALPGAKVEGTIKVSNNSPGESQGFISYAEDWIFNKEGGKEVKPAGSTPRSCSNWIKINPTTIDVKSSSFATVKYTIEVPKDAQGGYYALIFFETALPKTAGGFTGAALKGRIGATLSLDVKGTVAPKGTMTSLKVSRPDEDKPLKIDFDFKNEGNVALWGKGNLQIVDAQGNSYWKTDFDNYNTMPDGSISKTLEWSGKLNAGKYSAVVSVDTGGTTPVISETAFEVVKAGDIEKMTAAAAKTRKAKVYVKFANAGNLTIEPEVLVKIINAREEVVESARAEKDLVFPNTSKVFTAVFGKVLPRGKYKVLAELKYDNEVKTKEGTLVVM